MPATREVEQTVIKQVETGEEFVVGSFIEIMIKDGDNIACSTTFIEGAPTAQEARLFILDCLGQPDLYYQSEDGELMFALIEGKFHVRENTRRFIELAGQHFGIDADLRMHDLESGVFGEMEASLAGSPAKAGDTSGKFEYGFGSWIEGGRVKGWGMNGKPIDLIKLAMVGSDEHTWMLEGMEEALLSKESGMLIHVASDRSVPNCCPKFFDEKLNTITRMNGSKDFSSGKVSGREGVGITKCNNCGQTYLLSQGHECSNEME